MPKNQSFRITDSMRTTAEYLRAKQLFVERQELQSKLREVNRVLRQLQSTAGSLVALAKADSDAELAGFRYGIENLAKRQA